MIKFDELEVKLVGSLNEAVCNGVLLISGAHGIVWDDAAKNWRTDARYGVPVCDIFGSVLLCESFDPFFHRGEYERAIRLIIDHGFYTIEPDPDLDTLLTSEAYQCSQSVCNGWDGEACVGGFDSAYLLGKKLAGIYKPLSIDLLGLGSFLCSSLEVNQKPISTPEEDYADSEEFEGNSDIELVEFVDLERSSSP